MKGSRVRTFRRSWLLPSFLGSGLLLAAYLLSGRYPVPGFSSPFLFLTDETFRGILFSLRLPRAMAALLLGAVLGASGASFQIVFGNPLVEAGFLGVSQGAAFGAALALVSGSMLPLVIAGSAFVSALAALGATLWLASRFRFGGQVLRLVLSGLAVSAFFSSLLATIKYVADPLTQLPDITFWTMGSLATMSWTRLGAALPVAALSLVVLLVMRWRTTLLSLDESAARSLGLQVEAERAIVILAATAGVAAMTALCGIVAWIGLVVPHVARLATGADGRRSIPLATLFGAVFTLVADGLARSLFPGELPLGIVTSLLGSMLFAAILLSRKTELSR